MNNYVRPLEIEKVLQNNIDTLGIDPQRVVDRMKEEITDDDLVTAFTQHLARLFFQEIYPTWMTQMQRYGKGEVVYDIIFTQPGHNENKDVRAMNAIWRNIYRKKLLTSSELQKIQNATQDPNSVFYGLSIIPRLTVTKRDLHEAGSINLQGEMMPIHPLGGGSIRDLTREGLIELTSQPCSWDDGANILWD